MQHNFIVPQYFIVVCEKTHWCQSPAAAAAAALQVS